ncbi:hypothetical protein PR048_026886 [Dryococelus australis]|uniref:Uncharacterized protein n=1 Tax=Dryococelus australis TaxID=614101 RepID=A0ABQ9GMI8_9NEOP|nr:hypothetical protein PR048_026886 [Dryococelus australis]
MNSRMQNRQNFSVKCRQCNFTMQKVNFQQSENGATINLKHFECVRTQEKLTRWHEIIAVEGRKVNIKLYTGSEGHKRNSGVLCRIYSKSIVGIVNLRCEAKNVVNYMDFRIADADSTSILGLQACCTYFSSDDTTVKIINQNTSQLESPNCKFVQDNDDVFTGLGKFPRQCKISVHKNALPRAQPPRR